MSRWRRRWRRYYLRQLFGKGLRLFNKKPGQASETLVVHVTVSSALLAEGGQADVISKLIADNFRKVAQECIYKRMTEGYGG